MQLFSFVCLPQRRLAELPQPLGCHMALWTPSSLKTPVPGGQNLGTLPQVASCAEQREMVIWPSWQWFACSRACLTVARPCSWLMVGSCLLRLPATLSEELLPLCSLTWCTQLWCPKRAWLLNLMALLLLLPLSLLTAALLSHVLMTIRFGFSKLDQGMFFLIHRVLSAAT